MFYSPSLRGFYTPDLHGALVLHIDDPLWVRPTINITLQPGESFPTSDGTIKNDTEVPLDLADIEDWRIEHPQVEVPNPACQIPADAVEESLWPAPYNDLMAGQAAGQNIVPDENGFPVLVALDQPTAAELRSKAILVELATLDAAGARPARAIALAVASGAAPAAEDLTRLQEIEAQAVALREELAALEI
ncbi:MAG: hypothetical protein CGU28_04165 [Candidatus Dactylopiibacterium carminicum]|uniref:Uncharacterized protein n=1 Tax=Candidatus Dactylopiibacterium carminicum TaxID=857335 RepID=A0A272EXH2_9RHOO|nr:hypothetical protein [Candidatus Dactylopiibacterium carminicum]KAF7600167.1 hypothetical protein BGI27_03670 [Candidatus Dactylopiibacterium carminicum]PAS94813.1 MAG: hypothetical protein CGU29_02630 [Candidatus Dactylopiibacterium carminicum]PAS97737.1 MAG: hypothetical protein CGU28_04165 [Candidatus Dactylopiibacterium carminicum]PAT00170.1 MAG: hypothetical protein BSR46_03700 [Candidatus Dactylopiibacterium carminicum]